MFRQIHCSLLSEPWFEELSLPAAYLFLYFVIHPLTLPTGFVKLTPRRILRETPLTPEQFTQAQQELLNTKKVCFWPEYSIWWLIRFWKWQGGGPKWESHVRNSLSSLPSFAQEAFHSIYTNNTYAIPINTHAIPTEGDEGQNADAASRNINKNIIKTEVPPIIPLEKGDIPEVRVKRKTRKERKAELADRERYHKGKYGYLVQH